MTEGAWVHKGLRGPEMSTGLDWSSLDCYVLSTLSKPLTSEVSFCSNFTNSMILNLSLCQKPLL